MEPVQRTTLTSRPAIRGPRRRALCVMIAMALAAAVQAQTVIPPGTTPVVLSGGPDFLVETGATIDATGVGISGDGTAVWTLTNNGTIKGTTRGVRLSSSTAGATRSQFDNFGTVSATEASNAAGLGAAVHLEDGASLSNSGTLTSSSDTVFVEQAATVTNNGTITSTITGVYFDNGGTFLGQSGAVNASFGVIFDGGTAAGSNAGQITGGAGVGNNGLWFRNGATGSFTNTGTISSGTGVFFGTGNIELTNRNIIEGTAGAAISIAGNNNIVRLDTGSDLRGNANVISGSGNQVILQGSSATALPNQEDADFSGFATLTATQLADWTLTGTTTLTSGTTIDAGSRLAIGNGLTSGSLTGTLANAGALVFNTAAGTSTFAGAISGAGTLEKRGSGALILSGANTYTSATTVHAGTLRAGSATALPADNALTFTGPGASVDLNGFNLSLARLDAPLADLGQIALGANTLTLTGAGVAAGVTPTYIGTFSGAGQLTKNGTYTQRWGIPASTTINATVSAGVLDLFSAGNGTGFPLSGSIVDNAELRISNPGAATSSTAPFYLGANVSGSGRMVVDVTAGNGSRVVVTGALGHTGGTVVDHGNLQIGDTGTTGSLAGNVALTNTDARLSYVRSDAQTWTGTISGQGSLEVASGVLTLAGDNTYTGDTMLTGAGTLVLTAPQRISASSTIRGDGGVVRLDGAMTLPNPLSAVSIVGLVIDTFGTDDVLTGPLGGPGQLRKHGEGKLTLTTAKAPAIFPVIVHAGTFEVGDGGDVNGSDFRDGATLAFNRSDTYTYDGVISDSPADSTVGFPAQVGALLKSGSGTLILTANHTFSNGTTISGGTLQLGNNTATGGVLGNIVDNGALVLNRSDAVSFAGVISGTGAFTQAGSGELKLTGANTYTGGTTIGSGRVLHLGDGGTTGSIVGNVVNNGTLIANRSGSLALDGVISGTGTLIKRGSGELLLAGNNTFTGTTRLEQGIVGATQGSNFGLAGNTLQFDGGTLRWQQPFFLDRTVQLLSGGGTFDSNGLTAELRTPVSGAGGLTKTGAGTLVLSRDNLYTGTTLINAGTLQIGDGGTTGSIVGNIGNQGALVVNRSDNFTFSRQITGSGSVTKQGAGTVTLTSDQSYTGDTIISAGALQIGGGGASGRIAGNIVNNAALVFDHGSNAHTYAGTIGGTGTLAKQGSGTLTLSGDNSYTGLTTVTAGRLNVAGSIDGNVQVGNGATLGGGGTAGGSSTTVSVGNGGRLSPGTSPGTLQIGGALVLDAGAQLDYELGLPGTVGGGQNDLIQVAGDLTLDGTLNLFNMGGMSPGVYRLFDYGGTLVDQGLTIGASLPARFVPADFIVDVTVAGQVNLFAQSGGFALQLWDGGNTAPNGAIEGGSGTWGNVPTTWTGADGIVNAPWQSGFAVFQATPGVVTLGENVALQGMQFRSTGYSIEGGGFTLAGEPETFVNVDTLVTATLNAPLVDGVGGAARLVKKGAGLLVLGGANTYSGGTAIDNGAVQIAADNNLGAASGALSLNSAMLISTASFASARPVTIGADGGSFATEGSSTLTLSGAIDGPGVLSKVSTGTLILSGSNSHGGTFVGNGVLQASSDANLGAVAGTLALAGGVFRLGASFDPAPARPVVVGELGGTIDTQGFTATFAQSIGGEGALHKFGTGTLILAGDNDYTGDTTISAGTLQLGNGGDAGSVLGDIVNASALVVNRSDTFALASLVSGIGSLTQAGSGTLVLDSDHTYTGGTTITSGTLQLGNGGDTGSVPGDIVDNAALTFNHGSDRTFANTISGSGTVTKQGSNTLTLTANNTYSGNTLIADGVLQLGNGGTGGSIAGAVSSTGELAFNRSDDLTFANAISGNGRVRQLGSGTVTLGGANSYSGGTFLDAGVLATSADSALGEASGPLAFNGGTLRLAAAFDSARSVTLDGGGGTIEVADRNVLSGPLTGSGLLSKTGSGALVLTGAATHTGGTTIAAGTVQLGDGGTSGGLLGDVLNQGVLAVDRSDAYELDGVVSGSGSLLQAGSGTLILGSDHSYTGGTTIAAGTLQLGTGGDRGSVVGDILDNGALVFDHGTDRTFAGTISGSGTLTTQGGNTLTLTGNNTYAGPTTIDGGLLQLGAGGDSGAIGGDVANGGVLVFNRSGALALDGVISGGGSLRQIGTGTVTLTGANSYSGGTFLYAGTLSVGADGNLGDAASAVGFDGGTLQLSAPFDSARPLLIGGNGATLDVATRNKLSGPIKGIGALTKTGAGALIVNTDATYSGGTHVAAGTFVVGDSQNLQARLSGAGAVSVDAGASLGGYGTVVGSVDNRGTIGVGNALAALANEPDAVFNIIGPLANSGEITMVNAAAADRLNVSGTYLANGGTLSLETVLDAGGAAAQSDKLVTGSVDLGSGATGIVVHALAGNGAFTTGDGIELVDVVDPARSAAGAFVLAQRVVAGAHEYLLFQGGVNNAADGDWYLRNVAPEVEPPPEPGVVTPIFRPEVGAYLANRQATAASLVHTMHERLGEAQYAEAANDKDGFLGSVWLRARASNADIGAADGAIDIEGDRTLLQAGADLAQWRVFGDSDRLHLGGMLGYARTHARTRADFNPARANGDTEGTLAGVYATWFANDDKRLGSYLDAWAQYGWFDNRIRGDRLPRVDYDSQAWAVSLEYGHALPLGARVVIEPQLQIVHGNYGTDRIAEDNGTVVRTLDDSQTIGRLGVRLYRPRELRATLQPFVEVGWWHGESTLLSFNEVAVADRVPDNRYVLSVGLQGIVADGWNVWSQLGGEWGGSDYRQVNGQIGVKYSW